LWDTTQRFIYLPVFQISCVEELFDEIEESPVLDVFGECRNDEVMVQGAETVGYVALDDPNCAFPASVQ
jgi:hypothetical protein